MLSHSYALTCTLVSSPFWWKQLQAFEGPFGTVTNIFPLQQFLIRTSLEHQHVQQCPRPHRTQELLGKLCASRLVKAKAVLIVRSIFNLQKYVITLRQSTQQSRNALPAEIANNDQATSTYWKFKSPELQKPAE